jgi:hypothetical protein
VASDATSDIGGEVAFYFVKKKLTRPIVTRPSTTNWKLPFVNLLANMASASSKNHDPANLVVLSCFVDSASMFSA